ncbi:MAG: hypothetical protein HC785_22415 [Calothrix sp. CSU_2_0]|nr:hypothetical protein [Calothrix sp. CSU_2_0]
MYDTFLSGLRAKRSSHNNDHRITNQCLEARDSERGHILFIIQGNITRSR